jgi:UDP-3-O-[3-hydroxymyristoyl] glucosamine N-acyltransferase
MVDSRFFTNHGPFPLSLIAEISGATLANAADTSRVIADVAALERASEKDLSFFDNVKYLEQFKQSNAGACFIREKHAATAPSGMALLISDDPYRSYALAAQRFYPEPSAQHAIHTRAIISDSARISEHVTIGAGAVIGENVVIGDHCQIGANTVIADGVIIGDHTHIGALCSLSHCVIASRVILHRGVHIGQDGFGFALGRDGHIKVPQLGRVVIEEDVEIGSGTTIDRGTGPDTTIGAGAKIDNLVQIGHNVQIGKRAVIVAQTGISGSTRIGEGAVLGGQSGLAGHLKIGAGARIAAQSGVMSDIPPATSVGGSPAVTIKDWHRQTIALSKLIKKS